MEAKRIRKEFRAEIGICLGLIPKSQFVETSTGLDGILSFYKEKATQTAN